MSREQSTPRPEAIFSEHVFRLRMKRGVNPLYVHAFLNSELGQLQLETVISGGAQGGITRGFANGIFVPMIDQQEIIAQLWTEGTQRVNDIKRSYIDGVKTLKQQVDTSIENSRPISESDLETILGLPEEIENDLTENETLEE